ncbi:hypothetical protein [Actinomyces culturomici]|uniref:hypothetical protein n=1 Tax=Actinomyces culturomici TaxID=1926276 RepID=UPI000E202CDE|nr:hypothetical protein [Actinomyces culturomici]
MSGAEDLHVVRRQVAERLAAIAFVDRAQVGASHEERERAWSEFYRTCPDDLAYLIEAVDVLVSWIVAAASVATQIRDKKETAAVEERESAIGELASFLEDKAAILSREER